MDDSVLILLCFEQFCFLLFSAIFSLVHPLVFMNTNKSSVGLSFLENHITTFIYYAVQIKQILQEHFQSVSFMRAEIISFFHCSIIYACDSACHWISPQWIMIIFLNFKHIFNSENEFFTVMQLVLQNELIYLAFLQRTIKTFKARFTYSSPF